MNKKKIIGSGILILLILIISMSVLHNRTGFFSGISRIDSRDLAYWNYSDGMIDGANEFQIQGSNDTCWLLVHSYASTPKEYTELARIISDEFGDAIYVPRLEGHGEVPSHILNLSLNEWYAQIELIYQNLTNYCNQINIIGSSFGGAISARLAESSPDKLNNLYLINAYLSTTYNWYTLVHPDMFLKLMGDIVKYNKKTQIAQLNSLEGRANHVAYWTMPLIPAKNSLSFLKETKANLRQINATTLIIHSHNDHTADFNNALDINSTINSDSKKLLWFDNSNHLLLLDYDKENIFDEIIKWEKENR